MIKRTEKPSIACASNANTHEGSGKRLIRPAEGDQSDSKGFRPAHPLIAARTLGIANRGRLLQALYDMGPSSRVELARVTGASRATIGGIVQPLINQSILEEGDLVPPDRSGGKPATKLWFSKGAKPICAVRLMHDRVHTCLVSLEGELYAQHEVDLAKDLTDAADAFQIVSACIEKSVASADQEVLGIGMAVAGELNPQTGSIAAMDFAPYLHGFPIKAELAKRFGVPACVDQDARALLVGDRWFGQGRGQRNFAVVYIGQSLGAALYVDGHPYRAAGGKHCQIGHTIVQLNGQMCRCGRRGCWETIATLPWLRGEARARGLPQAGLLDASRLVWLAETGAKGAKELLEDYASNISVGLVNLQQLMAPSCITLHGDIVHGGKLMLDLIRKSVRQLMFNPGDNEIALALGDREDVAGLRGAAGLVVCELLNFII
ncbi:XylR-type repressor [Rhizobium freirei PRF 81]|uniref:XylR-type repressor n=3 Tax=Rhizobium TaxID=379 RepID=N6VB83_9HYPH|nr:XylR-type repressor [Rhizobium tropici CIAT 899]AYG70386.1 ROK family protein [Rhizobium sp. CCGE531]ENN88332.1 XylR-type repressor [Rhizobium freirei PRF 81]NEV13973.1 ROK family protein [Rhizobium tropici]TGE92754.1 ROK family protein [Rhizobium sp. SEMIA 4088]